MITSLVVASLTILGNQSKVPHVPPALPVIAVAQQEREFSASEREQIIRELIKQMNARYVMPDIAKKIESELTKWMKSDEFKSLNEPIVFATKVNEVLKVNVTDAHLRFRYSPNVLPERREAGEPSQAEIDQVTNWVRRQNATFRKVERLEGNIGYFAFDSFQSPEDISRPMAAAMNFLANTDAMIIDLRQNGGGDPSGVQVVCSYFFDEKPVHLNSIYFRPTDETHEFWTLEKVDAPRFLDKPVYVLVSKRTGSGAEECSYNLQQLKRATIIGEPTWGGANPGGSVRLHDHFSCFIPVGRAINPITKTNWEGSGVIPDIKCDPAKSLEQAQVLILKELIAKEKDDNYKSALEARLKTLAQG
ncbi:MAG: S41 family peptidase [Armatimonadetes bacterium]|nr:S41 family peptidase [Armatimonadota bacterium]